MRRTLALLLLVTGLAVLPRPAVATVDATTSAPAPAAVPSRPCPTERSHPWCDRSLGADRRARLFQQAMTLAEEARLLGGQGMGAAPHTGGTYAIPRLGLREVYLTDGPVGVRQGRATLMPVPMAP